jgi:hypothetical protein
MPDGREDGNAWRSFVDDWTFDAAATVVATN